MQGLIWTAAIWIIALTAANLVHIRSGRLASLTLTRERLSLALLLTAINAIAGRTSADEILANPVVIERAARGALAGLAAILIIPSLTSRLHRIGSRGLPGYSAVVIYLFVAVVSVSYSVAPIVSLGKAFELAVAVAIVAAAVLAANPGRELRQMVEFVLFLEGVLLAVAVTGFFVWPSEFSAALPRPGFIFADTMVSPFAHPNVMAAMGGVTAAYSLAAALDTSTANRRWWWAAFAGSTVAILLASGRQGVVIWIVSCAILLFLYRRGLFFIGIIPASAYVVSTYAETIWRAFNRNATYHLATLTGRLNWWQAALEAWGQHPWTGYGFGAGGRFVALRSVGAGGRSNVHSGYIEALVGVGLLGVLPLLFAVVRASIWSLRSLFRRTDVRYAILLVPIILHTAIDLGFGAWLKPDFVILACLIGLADITALGRKPDLLEAAADSHGESLEIRQVQTLPT